MKFINLVGFTIFLCLATIISGNAQQSIKIGLLKYNGGGDWYANPTSLPNLIKFCNKNLKTSIQLSDATVEVGSPELFEFPFVHMTGHGNVIFSDDEAANLRKYLLSGGFLHVDDNYGLDQYFRREMKKVFPELDFIELPFSHPIYNQKYKFAEGLPKIHEHDAKRPQGFGLIFEGRLLCFYTFESDLGDGWEDQDVHNDSEEKRIGSFKNGRQYYKLLFYKIISS